MRKLLLLLVPALALALAACVPTPPPERIVVGDSVASQVGEVLAAENDAVGGTTVCDTANDLPDVQSKVLVHTAGHSWGYYDAATAQFCLLHIIDHYAGKQVLVALAPTPMAIACGDIALAQAAFGFPIYGDADYELRQRIEDFNNWKLTTLRTLRPNVQLVDWRGAEHYGWPDCTHLTPAGISYAASKVVW